MKTIIIDNGHGSDTPGKCSPDGSFREYSFNRALAAAIIEELRSRQMKAVQLVPEDRDVPLSERCRRVNALASAEDCVLLSVHVNAASNCGWTPARGACAIVSPYASAQSRELASRLWQGFCRAGFQGNRNPGASGYYEQNLHILRGVTCPAVLTENLFMDNAADLAMLKAGTTLYKLAEIHINALCHE